MICAIALLFGCYDLGSHILLFLVNASMNLFGLLMEKMNNAAMASSDAREFDELSSERSPQTQSRPSVDWTPFVFGCVAGIAGWILIALYFFGNPSQFDKIPKFVYAILFSYFFFFNTFPINMWLQYAKIG